MMPKQPERPALNAQTQINLFVPIETNYVQLREGRAAFLSANPSDMQRTEYGETLDAARDAYWAAVADALADNTPFVIRLRDDLNTANGQVKNKLKALNDLVAFLKLAAEATRLAASLARLAAI